MSDQDELRDRIADILEALDGMDLDQQAQAIIDEFGMTVETAVDMSTRTTDKRTGNVRYGEKTRIVGKWEKQ